VIRIFIDQGHNPRNPNAGAEGNGFREQDITYRVGVALARLLNANPDFEVCATPLGYEAGLYSAAALAITGLAQKH